MTLIRMTLGEKSPQILCSHGIPFTKFKTTSVRKISLETQSQLNYSNRKQENSDDSMQGQVEGCRTE